MADARTDWPNEVRLTKDRSAIALIFDGGRRIELEAEYLRVKSPSAEVRGHGPGEGITVAAKRDVLITGLEPVGNYAIRITFDDGHATGIYSWTYLQELETDRARIWGEYLQELSAQRLKRDP